jgi:hypothetical protein
MKMSFLCAAVFVLSATSFAAGQNGVEPTPTPVKVVVTNSMPAVKPASTPAPRISPTPIVVGSPERSSGPAVTPESPAISEGTSTRSRIATGQLSFGQIKAKIADAKRQLQSRPLATALVEGTVPTDYIRIAFNDSQTNRVDFFVLSKEAFLSVASEKFVSSESGRQLRVKTIRGNGVNTPITITDDAGDLQLPLMVQYPVVRNGQYMETAYYMSTHPGLVTPEVVNAGRYYVRNVIEIAREKLREKGIVVSPKLADIAERLATVEHIDHMRFRTEHHPDIFNDVFTLYALNEGQTYRYSVSSAGAGGMVQMIPSTYRMVRSWHPNIALIPDFVEGMRNHVNASQAMLLYMNRTWNDLIASPTVATAFSNGIATQEQLMAAGYNSNPAKLAGYINRGGSNWTSLIPRETKIYLQIYDSIERHVPMTPRTK